MATNETIFTHSAQAALRLLPKIHAATAQMLYAHEKGQLEDANQLAFDAERQVEKLVNSYRMIPTFLGSPSAKMEVEMIISEEIPVEIGFTDEGWFSLRIPRLLPRKERGKGSYDYIRGYLYPAMQRFFQNEYPVRFDDCVLIYRHIYNRHEPERQYRDHDNIELNFVTDTVALFMANGKLRAMRTDAHRVFDQLYLKHYMPKKTAYAWLSATLEVPIQKAHIGLLSELQCELVIRETKKLLAWHEAHKKCNRTNQRRMEYDDIDTRTDAYC